MKKGSSPPITAGTRAVSRPNTRVRPFLAKLRSPGVGSEFGGAGAVPVAEVGSAAAFVTKTLGIALARRDELRPPLPVASSRDGDPPFKVVDGEEVDERSDLTNREPGDGGGSGL